MKQYKTCLFCILFFLFLYFPSSVSLAGDVPESLLYGDYPVYFGMVKEVSGQNITIIQMENIKGPFIKNAELSYPDYVFTDAPKIGQIYLCGYINENNPLYIWEVDCYDTSTLTIMNTDNMSKRMQKYLNDGLFEQEKTDNKIVSLNRCISYIFQQVFHNCINQLNTTRNYDMTFQKSLLSSFLRSAVTIR